MIACYVCSKLYSTVSDMKIIIGFRARFSHIAYSFLSNFQFRFDLIRFNARLIWKVTKIIVGNDSKQQLERMTKTLRTRSRAHMNNNIFISNPCNAIDYTNHFFFSYSLIFSRFLFYHLSNANLIRILILIHKQIDYKHGETENR